MLDLLNRLQLKDYRLIQAIAETGQLALAAERLSVSQPAASRMLAGIERLAGVPLFARHPKGMTPTPIGETLARNANGLLRSLEQTLQETEAAISGRAGTVRVGSVTGGAVGFVVPAIRRLKKTAPEADIHIDVAPSDILIAGLLRGDYDFVLSRIPPGTDARQFAVRRGRVEVIRFLVRRSHPLVGRGPLKPEQLVGHEWVIQAPHTPMRQAVEEAFFSYGIPLPGEIVNTTSLLVMIAYLNSTDAIAPISREVADLVAPAGEESRLAALDLEEPIIVNPYHLISLKNQAMSPLAIRLRNLIFEGLSDTSAGTNPGQEVGIDKGHGKGIR
ncbi:DNA-binding transcriptional LysR family regulator [Mesorhizobium sp. J18]|uniref:LysR family transcriptional regulator n=1 Tax=Mesorhizobium sp. J18 TaxID=935263 RepID=UPI00119A0223|nr:LysR family transcriptional regulator [Mesorhizobium sp. J18]TWG97320.1 DNA-binding transcriptional LysR family regulator [Mesorhizobium sp. J18]